MEREGRKKITKNRCYIRKSVDEYNIISREKKTIIINGKSETDSTKFPSLSPPYRISRLAAETKHGNESVDKGFCPIKDVSDFVPCRGSGTVRWMFSICACHSIPPTPRRGKQTFLCVIKNIKLKAKTFHLSMIINHARD